MPALSGEGMSASEPAADESACAHDRPMRISYAWLRKRVFEIDMPAAEPAFRPGGEPGAALRALGQAEYPKPPRSGRALPPSPKT